MVRIASAGASSMLRHLTDVQPLKKATDRLPHLPEHTAPAASHIAHAISLPNPVRRYLH